MNNDDFYMRLALDEAEKAGRKGEVPVGAVILGPEGILARDHNRTIELHDPTAHAEVLCLRKAGRTVGNHRLTDCDLYVTLEPCPMCVGALVQARIRRLVFGAADPKGGGIESIMSFPFDRINHRPAIISGILGEECGTILRDFFRLRRS